MKFVDPTKPHRKSGGWGPPLALSRFPLRNHKPAARILLRRRPAAITLRGTMQADEPEFSGGQVLQLTGAAADAARQAYAPYSGFRVGAALLLENGAIVTGANVENASYGLTICAERSAVVRAVAEYGPQMRVRACAITNLNQAASPPCGACLQVLSEFMRPASRVIFLCMSGWEDYCFDEVLPHRFALRGEK
jgi:cytidine deaminase